MGKYIIVENCDFSNNCIGEVITQPDYTIPLRENVTPTKGNESLTYQSSSGVTFNDGAVFNSYPAGLIYMLNDDIFIWAVSMEFKISDSAAASTRFLLNTGYYTEGHNGWYVYIASTSGGQLQMSVKTAAKDTADSQTLATLTTDAFHKLCFSATSNGELLLYIDGEKITIPSGYSALDLWRREGGYVIIGNGWRFRKNDGDRSFKGIIRDVNIWTKEITENDMIYYSTIQNNG